MTDTLALAIMVVSLSVAAWCLLRAYRDGVPERKHEWAVAVVGLVCLVQAVVAVVRWIGGTDPIEPATFIGYLLTVVLLPPAAIVLARLEPTRWGTAILGFCCLVVPVLVLRLQQVWG